MNKIVHLSLTKKDVPIRIDVVQYATKPSIVFVLDDYTPSAGATASLYIKKPDGTEIYNTCSIENNLITYEPTTQSFAVLGTSKCQLQIVESDDTAVSFVIYADVTENIIDSSAIESQNEFTALEEALQTVSDYDGRIASNTNRLDNLGGEHVTFTEAETDATISDNLTLSTIFGRIKHLFTRVKSVEDKYVIKNTNHTSTVSVGSGNIAASNTERVQTWVTNTNDESFAGIFREESIGLWQGSVGWKWHLLTKPKVLTITRIENSYVNATSTGRLKAYELNGFLWFAGNLGIDVALPPSTGVDIAQISGWSAPEQINANIPNQAGTGSILLTISTTGTMNIYNGNSSAVSGWVRMPLCVPKA